MRRQHVTSRSIASVGYDAHRRVLELEYRGGNVYAYEYVPAPVYDALMASESKGKFVNYYIKGRYPYRRVH